MLIEIEDKFRVGASQIIGSFILPGEIIDTIYQEVNRKIKLTVAPCKEIVKAIKEKKLDLGFIEFPLFDDSVVYREWIEDEMVVCSKKSLPNSLGRDDLNQCRIVCNARGEYSREFIEEFLENQELSIYDFDAIFEVDNVTSIIQSIKWSKPHAPITTIAIVSSLAIEYELKYKDLYQSSINSTSLVRKFYIIYREDSNYIDIIKKICDKLLVLI